MRRYITEKSPELLKMFLGVQRICSKYFPKEALLKSEEDLYKAVSKHDPDWDERFNTPYDNVIDSLVKNLISYFNKHQNFGIELISWLDTEEGRQELINYQWSDDYLDDTYLLAIQKLLNEQFRADRLRVTVDFMSSLNYYAFLVSSMVTQNNIAEEEGQPIKYKNFDEFLEKTNWDVFFQFAYSYFKNVKSEFGLNLFDPYLPIDFIYPVKLIYKDFQGNVKVVPLGQYFNENTKVQNKLIIKLMQSQLNHVIAHQIAEKYLAPTMEEYSKFYAGNSLYRRIPNYLTITNPGFNETDVICNDYIILNIDLMTSLTNETSDYKRIIDSLAPAYSYEFRLPELFGKEHFHVIINPPTDAYLLKKDIDFYINNKEVLTKYVNSYIEEYLKTLNLNKESLEKLLKVLVQQKGEVIHVYQDFEEVKERNGLLKLFTNTDKEQLKKEFHLGVESLNLNKTSLKNKL